MAAHHSPVLVEARSVDERMAVKAEVEFAPVAVVDEGRLPQARLFQDHVPQIIPPKPLLQAALLWLDKNLRTEAEFGTGFLFLPVWLGCGALIYFMLEVEPPLTPLLALCGLMSGAAFLARNHAAPRLIFTALLMACLGVVAAKVETIRYSTVMMGSEVTTRISGTLVHAEEITNGRTRLIIDVQSTERPKLKFAPERIRVSARGNFTGVEAGSSVSGLVKLFALPGPVQPNGYDFAFESYFDGVGAAGFFLGKPEFSPSTKPKTTLERIDAARSALTAHIRSILPGETGAVVAALVTGIRGAVVEADNEALRRSGLAHIMSISGLHLALAAGVLIAAIRLGFAMIPVIANHWPVKKIAASAGIIMAILYCFISGSEVATLRSTIMIVVMLGAVLAGRPAITMRNLAIAAFVLLLIWPHEIAGPGFQMSFAATAGLIAIYRWWARRAAPDNTQNAQPRGWFWRAFDAGKIVVLGTVLSSTVAGLATLPFGAFHFERLAPWGTLSNLLSLPAVSLVIMPSAVAAMVAMPFGLDGYIWPIMALGVDFMLWLAHAIASLGGPDATGPVPVAALLAATFALIVFCLPQTHLRWLGVLPLIAATGIMMLRDEPVLFVDENAKLIAFVTQSGGLAVNSSRPDDFALKNWQRTVQTTEVIKPVAAKTDAPDSNAVSGFVCSKDLCTGILRGGLRIAHAKTAQSVEQGCKAADVLIQGFAGPPVTCGNPIPVLTAGMLARNGAAAFYEDEKAQDEKTKDKTAKAKTAAGSRRRAAPLTSIQTPVMKYRIEWSYTALGRPWQGQRTFSRPARDLAPKPKRNNTVFTGTGLQPRVDREV